MWWTRHASRELGPYCDGQLAAARRRAVDAHLAECARCRAELDDIRFAAGLVRQLATVTPPASVWTSIEHALEGKSGQNKGADPFFESIFPRVRWAVASLVVLLAVGGSAYWYAGRPPVPALRVGGTSESKGGSVSRASTPAVERQGWRQGNGSRPDNPRAPESPWATSGRWMSSRVRASSSAPCCLRNIGSRLRAARSARGFPPRPVCSSSTPPPAPLSIWAARTPCMWMTRGPASCG